MPKALASAHTSGRSAAVGPCTSTPSSSPTSTSTARHLVVDETARGPALPFGGDRSVANGSSIAFLFEHGHRGSALHGRRLRASPRRVDQMVARATRASTLAPRLVQAVPPRQPTILTPELLELVDCDSQLVCTDESKEHHPALRQSTSSCCTGRRPTSSSTTTTRTWRRGASWAAHSELRARASPSGSTWAAPPDRPASDTKGAITWDDGGA